MNVASPHRNKGAFSLVELLVVLAIMSTLVGIASYSFLASGSSALMVSASEISSFTTLARSIAIGNGTITRVCILVNSPISAADNYSLISIWSYDRAASQAATPAGTDIWKQETKWQRLPTGIVVDNTYSDTQLPLTKNIASAGYSPNFAISTFKFTQGSAPITVNGQAITDANCKFIEFDGTGGLSDETAGTVGFRLVQGVYPTPPTTPTYTHSVSGSTTTPADFGIITVNGLTGSVKMIRK